MRHRRWGRRDKAQSQVGGEKLDDRWAKSTKAMLGTVRHDDEYGKMKGSLLTADPIELGGICAEAEVMRGESEQVSRIGQERVMWAVRSDYRWTDESRRARRRRRL